MDRYVQGKTQDLSLTVDEYKRDIDRMGQTIDECRLYVLDKYHKGYDRLSNYFAKMLDVFEVAKITCDCIISDLQKQKEKEYYFRAWYRRLQLENGQLRYQVQSIVEEMRAECQIQMDRMKQEVNAVEEHLRKEQIATSKLRAQLNYERHMFGNDYVVQGHERVKLYEKSNSHLMMEIEKFKSREKEMNACIDNIIQSRRSMEKEWDREKAVVRALQLENQELREASINDHDDQKTIRSLQLELEELKSNREKSESDEKTIKTLQLELEELKSNREKSENDEDKLHQLEKQLETARYEVTRMKQELDSTKTNADKVHRLEKQLETSKYEVTRMTQELDSTKDRLSKLMSIQMTDSNPNIADLSDKNRPTKLAERYSELYDNQWTDALDLLDDKDDTKKALMLLDILKDTMQFCRKEADHQITKLKHVLCGNSDTKLSDMTNKHLKDIRKETAEDYGEVLYQRYVESLRKSTRKLATDALKVQIYLKECFQLCWVMNVQDPPVVLGKDVQPSTPFDTQNYKAYTVSGPVVDYVVWPPLLLHEGGSLLSKGVAQGRGKMDKKEEPKIEGKQVENANKTDKEKTEKLEAVQE